jgi:hypothetical protein
VATRGARAAGGDAAPDSDFPSGNPDYPPYRNGWGERMARVFRRATSLGLLRRRKSDHRTLFRRRASRALCRFGPADRGPQTGCDRHRNQSRRDRLQGGNQHNTGRCVHAGPAARGVSHQPRPTRRQSHRHHPRCWNRDLGEAPADIKRSHPFDNQGRISGYARGVGRCFSASLAGRRRPIGNFAGFYASAAGDSLGDRARLRYHGAATPGRSVDQAKGTFTRTAS